MSERDRLLREARIVLERYLFDGDRIRDDIAEMCMKIEEELGPERPEQRAADEVFEERQRLIA